MSKLPPRQQRFVDEYLKDLSGTKAAIRAGFSPKSAAQQATNMLAIPRIRDAIDAAKIERMEATKVDADYVLRRLVAEAEANIADLYDEDGKLKPIHEWPEIFRTGLVAGVETDELYEGQGKDRKHIGTRYKVRFSDRLRRIELIGKHVKVNAFQDVVEHKGLDGLRERLRRANAKVGSRRK